MADKEFDPKGKTFTQRLQAFLDDAKKTHKVTVGKDSGRTKEWQQKNHVGHMFLYNKYNSIKPANIDKGKKTISWDHFSDPKVIWNSVKMSDFLKTTKNTTPVKEGQKWKKGSEPDEEATKKHVKAMLIKAQIGNSGTAMVSSGLKPCGEPCKCGAGRSKHLANLAADLNRPNLKALTLKLKGAGAGTLDEYLKQFGLHRPLLKHVNPEDWHVESL